MSPRRDLQDQEPPRSPLTLFLGLITAVLVVSCVYLYYQNALLTKQMAILQVEALKASSNRQQADIDIAPVEESSVEPVQVHHTDIKPVSSVISTKMNVLYIGVDNTLSITASGITADRIQATIQGGVLRKGKHKGEYIARVTRPGEVSITVTMQEQDGQYTQLGKHDFRVKRVPDPIAKIAGMSGGQVKSGTFKAQRGIMAVLENFDHEFKFSVMSFEMTYIGKGQEAIVASAKGPIFDQKMQEMVKRCKPGDVFLVDKIKAKAEDGTIRILPSIGFKII